MVPESAKIKRTWPRNLLFAAVVFIQFISIFLLKVNYSKTQQAYDPRDETAYYWSESAFQYRHAKLIGEGKAIPAVDIDAQYPEGVETSRELTLFMERITGLSYQLLNRVHPIPFRDFVIYFFSFVSSLSILVFYFAALQISDSPLYAALMTAVYTFNPASWTRFIANFVYEGFAMPWLFLGFTMLLLILNGKEKTRAKAIGYSILAGISICIGLISWHFARFYLFVLSVAVMADYFIAFEDLRASGIITEAAGVIAACCFFTGLISPVLRQNAFITSPPMLLLYALGLTQGARVLWGLSRNRCLSAYTAIVVLFASAVMFSRSSDSSPYGHVYSIFIFKLVNFLQKPAEPGLLPMDARLLWVNPFNSPALAHVVYLFFSPSIVLGGVWASKTLHKRAPVTTRPDALADSRGAVTVLVALAFIALYILVERLLGLAIFFLALYCLHIMVSHIRSRAVILSLLIFMGFSETAKAFLADSKYNLLYALTQKLPLPNAIPFGEFAHKKSVLEWISAHTRPGARFLSGIGIAPQVLTYAKRPIILQPKFESSGMREKYADFLRALYGDENEFFDFCRKFGADYFIYESSFIIDSTNDGARYMADALTIRPTAAAFRLHFAPESLKRFQLVYQDSDYRIFHVGTGTITSTFIPYEDSAYSRDEISGLSTSNIVGPNSTQQLWTKLLARIQHLKKADTLIARGELETARAALRGALNLFPLDAETWMRAAELDLKLNRGELALQEASRSAKLNPNLLNPQKFLAAIFLQTDKLDLAIAPLKRMTELQPLDPVAYNNLGVIYFKRREYRLSKDFFSKACQLNPADSDYAQNCSAIRKVLQ